LKQEAGKGRATLAGRSLVGRAAACAVRLASPRASGEHAVLFWDGGKWTVRDLGSTNGTFVAGRRITVGERVPLAAGTALAFGDEADAWTLVEAGPPNAGARREETGELILAEHGLLALPDGADPRATIFEDRSGRWMIEAQGEVRPAVDQARVDADGAWVLHVPPPAEDSVPTTHALSGKPKLIGATVLRFEVSHDEEHIALSLVHGGEVQPLGARAYGELLLLLARQRLRDRDEGLPAPEQGWIYVDELMRMLKLDRQHLNVNVFRARQHLARVGVLDVGALVEHQPTARRIRFGTDAVEIIAA
jgi:hypothetical protein